MKHIQHTWLALIFFVLIGNFVPRNLCAQINITTGQTPQWYVQNVLLGQGVQVSNINYVGLDNQIGQYTVGGAGPLEFFSEGLVLHTGQMNQIPGPNNGDNDVSAGIGGQTFSPGANDQSSLTTIVNSNIFDVVVLEFDFKPVSSVVEFQYVFASDEYLEYVGTPFNDVFAFFISGPGIPGQKNIALIPNTNVPVSINNVNNDSYSQYYVNNPPFSNSYNTSFDGFTKQLTARIDDLSICETYHIKIAIADVTDPVWDSAVFLKAKSFNSPGYTADVTPGFGGANPSVTYESCDGDIWFKFFRFGELSGDESYPFVISGTATNGVDYTLSKNTIDFPPGATADSIALHALFDNIPEGYESVTITYKPPIACDSLTLTAYIVDADTSLYINPQNDTTICGNINGELFTFTALVNNGIGNLKYTWSNLNGEVLGNQSFLQLLMLHDTTVVVKVEDLFCDIPTQSDTVHVTFLPISPEPLTINLPDSIGVCPGQSVFLDPAVTGGSGTYSYSWIINGSTEPTITVTPIQDTEVILLVDDGCGFTAKSVMLYLFQPLRVVIQDTTVCPGKQVSMVPTIIEGSLSYTDPVWQTIDGTVLFTGNPFNFTPNTTIDIVVTVMDTCNVVARDTATISIFSPLVVEDINVGVLCAGDQVTVNAVATGSGTLSYLWEDENGNVIGTGGSIILGPADTTSYSVTVTDTCNTVIKNFDVNVIPANLAFSALSVVPEPVCSGAEVTITATITGGSLEYFYDWGGGLNLNQIVQVLNDTTTFSLQVTDGCITIDTTFSVPVYPPLVLLAEKDTVLCDNQNTPLRMFPTGGNGVYTHYYWVNLNTNDTIGTAKNIAIVPPVGTTQYVGIVKDGCGDYAKDTVTVIVKPRPVINAGTDVTICMGESTQLNGTVNLSNACLYQWSPADGLSNPNALNPIAQPTVTTIYTLTTICDGCDGTPDVVTVYVKPRPIAVIPLPDMAFCKGSGGVTIPAAGTSGTAPLSYQWFPSEGLSADNISTPKANPNQDTTLYKFVVTDTYGCVSDTAQVTIYRIDIPIADAGPDIALCADAKGDTLKGRGIGGDVQSYEYFWTPATGLNDPNVQNPIARPLVTTTYTLKVISKPYNCESQNIDDLSTVTVTVSPRPVVDPGPNRAICSGESVQIGQPATGAGPDYTYEWTPTLGLDDPTSAQPNASPPQTITYLVKAISNGCISDGKNVTVTVNPRPTIAVQDVEDICPGESVQLKTTIGGALPGLIKSYRWEPPTGLSDPNIKEPIASPTQTTVYTLSVAIEGCVTQQTDTVHVSVHPTLAVDANPANTVVYMYEGTSVVLPATLGAEQGYYLQWSPTNSLSDANILQPIASPTQNTTYTLEVVRGRCKASDTVSVVIVPKFHPNIIGSKARICKGETVYLQAFGLPNNATFSWAPTTGILDTNLIQLAAKPEQTITYTITMTDRGFSETALFHVEVLPQPVAKFDYTVPEGCKRNEVSFRDLSTAPYHWEWNMGDGSPVLNVQHPKYTYEKVGEYLVKLKVIGYGGCWDTTSSKLYMKVYDTLAVDFSSEPPLGSKMTLHNHDAILGVQGNLEPLVRFSEKTPGAVAWMWQFGDGQSSTDPNPLHRYESDGIFDVTLTVIDEHGCVYSGRKGPYVVIAPEVQIPNVFTPNGDDFNDKWFVRYNGLAPIKIAVFDRWGNLHFESNTKEKGWDGTTLDGAQAPTGTYYYMVYVGDKPYDGSITLLR